MRAAPTPNQPAPDAVTERYYGVITRMRLTPIPALLQLTGELATIRSPVSRWTYERRGIDRVLHHRMGFVWREAQFVRGHAPPSWSKEGFGTPQWRRLMTDLRRLGWPVE